MVKDGVVVGEGCHIYSEKKHAEVKALEQAGADARGATLYINLEPCCHRGRTPPCVNAVLNAGIQRVVAAMPIPIRWSAVRASTLCGAEGFRWMWDCVAQKPSG